MQLGDFIKKERKKKGLLMRQLASLIDVDTSLISKIENGYRSATKEQLKKIALILDVDINTLISTWYAEKLYQEIKNEEEALRILKLTEHKIKELDKK